MVGSSLERRLVFLVRMAELLPKTTTHQSTKMNTLSGDRACPEPEPSSMPDATPSRTPRNRKPKSGRESVESFVVVFVSFLLWSLEAEGFVIPTGTMAPTMMGRHKEVICPECGYTYKVNAGGEVDSAGQGGSMSRRVVAGTCENCRFECPVDDMPSFTGDRIYVAKDGLSLPFLDKGSRVKLKRWDVAVFKLPEEPEVRYIKRLIGMPNEVIRIDGGDLWVRPLDSSGDFERLLRPVDHQQAMQLPVYDDSHRAAALESDNHWLRWAAAPGDDWAQPVPGSYSPAHDTPDWSELRYHHVVPSPAQWASVRAGRPLPSPPVPSLITDYYSYNTDVSARDRSRKGGGDRAWFQPHWVGDLTLSLRLTSHEPAGKFRLELIRAGISHRCEIDLVSGMAQLFRGAASLGDPVATEITHAGTYDLAFANVDSRLTLWINGHLPFGDGTRYATGDDPPAPTATDLEPARIGAYQASIEVDRLFLKRDVYYTLEPAESDYSNLDGSARTDASALLDLLADPGRFPRLSRYPAREYPIRPGYYMMLGDNSPWSRDGRAWGNSDQIDPDLPGQGWDSSGRQPWEVPEALLIGKAFCVYWPHPEQVWPRLRLTTDTRLPILPSVGRMRWIR